MAKRGRGRPHLTSDERAYTQRARALSIHDLDRIAALLRPRKEGDPFPRGEEWFSGARASGYRFPKPSDHRRKSSLDHYHLRSVLLYYRLAELKAAQVRTRDRTLRKDALIDKYMRAWGAWDGTPSVITRANLRRQILQDYLAPIDSWILRVHQTGHRLVIT